MRVHALASHASHGQRAELGEPGPVHAPEGTHPAAPVRRAGAAVRALSVTLMKVVLELGPVTKEHVETASALAQSGGTQSCESACSLASSALLPPANSHSGAPLSAGRPLCGARPASEGPAGCVWVRCCRSSLDVTTSQALLPCARSSGKATLRLHYITDLLSDHCSLEDENDASFLESVRCCRS